METKQKLFNNLTYDEALYVICHPGCPELLTEAARRVLRPYKAKVKTLLEDAFTGGTLTALVAFLNLEGVLETYIYKDRGDTEPVRILTFDKLKIYWVPQKGYLDVIGLSDEAFEKIKHILNNI